MTSKNSFCNVVLRAFFLLAVLFTLNFQSTNLSAQELTADDYAQAINVDYYADVESIERDEYVNERCRLDIIYPKNPQEPFATIIWFHGGGLTGGQKHIPSAFQRLKAYKEGRLAIIAAGYRLSPKVPFPVFIEDAAAATAWVLKHISEYGGDPRGVFVSGGSAGGYLTTMLTSYPKWLNACGADRSQLAGILPVSGQMTTHFHVKELLKYPGSQYNPVIDENAPLGGLSADYPPALFILGDRKVEWKCRVEENELMVASLRALGAPLVEFSENEGFTHGISGMGDDITKELIDEIDAFISRALEFKAQTERR